VLKTADYQRLAEFRYHLRRFLRFSEQAAARVDLNAQQHQALLAIKGTSENQVTIGRLAERLGIRHNTAVELANRLIAGRLVQRRQNPDDRRQVLLRLTTRAEQILAKLSLAHRDELKTVAPLLRQLLADFGPKPS
jgi:DNA-binding MarR family transcriptional regulator